MYEYVQRKLACTWELVIRRATNACSQAACLKRVIYIYIYIPIEITPRLLDINFLTRNDQRIFVVVVEKTFLPK